MSDVRLNDAAWEQLFQKYNILDSIAEKGIATISAAQIKEFREPRLMVKFDHAINLPALFEENHLSILPVTRGDYVISHFDAYHRFEPCDSQVVRASLPAHVQSLDSNHIPSEAIALNCAFASGIIADFMEDTDVVPTVSGRMGSGVFTFIVSEKNNGDIIHSSSHIFIEVKVECTQRCQFLIWSRKPEKPFVKHSSLIADRGEKTVMCLFPSCDAPYLLNRIKIW